LASAAKTTSDGGPADASKNAEAAEVLETSRGKLELYPIRHATVWLRAGEKIVWVDPWSQADLAAGPPADLVLVTDIHGDHFDAPAIAKVSKPGTMVVGPKVVAEKLAGVTVLDNGAKLDVGEISLEGVPMYNLRRGPSEGKLFHDKGRGNGYVLAFGGKRVYFSGDTECTPEMRALRSIDVAFVCMNLPYTMPPSEAAECVKAFAPKVLVPYHYRGQNLDELAAPLAGTGIAIHRHELY
jgi:L-ascorbate metabolism protein UlaG (beta-lactamase superfamily)